MPSSVVPSWRADRLAQGEQLLVGAPTATATGSPSPSVWVRRAWWRSRGRRPRCDSAQLGCHGVDLLGRGLVADRVGAHHVAADGAVADEEAGVDADVAVEPVEVLGEGLPVPVDALLERGERHALDPGHHPRR